MVGGEGRRDLGISILGEIWIVPFLERMWVRLKKERDNVGLPETQRERERQWWLGSIPDNLNRGHQEPKQESSETNTISDRHNNQNSNQETSIPTKNQT